MRSPAESMVSAVYACWSQCDFTSMLDLFSANIEIAQADGLPGGSHFVGYEGIANFVLGYRWYLRAEFAPRLILPSGRDLVVIGRLKGRSWHTRRAVEMDFVHVWTVDGGAIVRLRVVPNLAAVRSAPEVGTRATRSREYIE